MYASQSQDDQSYRTWRTRRIIWDELVLPNHHPIANRFQKLFATKVTSFSILPVTLMSWFVCLVVGILIFRDPGSIILVWFPLLAMLSSSPYVLIWTYRIATNIAGTIRDGTLDQYSITPPGRLFVCMMICKIVLHENDAIGWISLLRRMVNLGGTIALAMGLLLTMALTKDNVSSIVPLLRDMLLMLLILYTEHSQSVVIGCLIAIMTARRVNNSTEIPGIAILTYISLQIFMYISVLFIVLILQGKDYSGQIQMLITDLVSSIALIYGLFFLLREVLILSLWRINAQLS